MKRYWLFSGQIYYPGGGMDDFIGSYDTVDEAKAVFPAEDDYRYSWAHIFDFEKELVIFELGKSSWVEVIQEVGKA